MKKGFTLIELLVVIAIIGLLASIVAANLNTARQKGRDAAIKEDMVSLRSQAALYRSTSVNNNYGARTSNRGPQSCDTADIGWSIPQTTLFADAKIRTILEATGKTANGSITTATNLTCAYAGATGGGVSYAVMAPLFSKTNNLNDRWCVDSNGASKFIAGNVDLPPTFYLCP